MRPASWLAVAALAACGAAQGGGLVDGRIELPKQLRELSGCVATDERTLVCVQDEKGALWFADLRGERKIRSESFGPAGDYEGLARAADAWWVLRSDGVLLQLAPRDGAHAIAREVALPGGHPDWEALCFDADGKRLLAMPKTCVGDDKEARDRRPLFAVDPATGAVAKEPVLTLSRRALQAGLEKLGTPLPTKATDKGNVKVDFELAVSEIAIVPGKREMLVLAGGDRLLLRVDFAGQLLGARALVAKDLPQAEGLAFLPDGRLLVASEAAGMVSIEPLQKACALVVPLP
ncbi:MAG: hypothetical protein FJ301_13110 [Planctomycetes bacterium]|nr:hypothetical protein [Planctomycetota bacterium]